MGIVAIMCGCPGHNGECQYMCVYCLMWRSAYCISSVYFNCIWTFRFNLNKWNVIFSIKCNSHESSKEKIYFAAQREKCSCCLKYSSDARRLFWKIEKKDTYVFYNHIALKSLKKQAERGNCKFSSSKSAENGQEEHGKNGNRMHSEIVLQ